MVNLFRHQIFRLALLVGLFLTIFIVLVIAVITLWRSPWLIIDQPRDLTPGQIGMLKWHEIGQPRSFLMQEKAADPAAKDIAGIAFDGNHLWVSGTISDTEQTASNGAYVFQFDPASGNIAGKVKIPTGVNPRGVAFDGAHIWVANNGTADSSADSNVICFPQGIDLTAEDAETKIVPRIKAAEGPYYIAAAGDHVWVSDRDGDAIWRLPANDCSAPDEKAEDQDVKITGFKKAGSDTAQSFNTPVGIIFDGTYTWVADRGSDQVIRLLPHECKSTPPEEGNGSATDGVSGSTPEKGSDPTTTTSICAEALSIDTGSGSRPLNLAFDGTFVWVTLNNQEQVLRIHAETGAKYGDPIDVGREPWGLTFDGVNMWVANNGDKSVTKLRALDGKSLGTFSTGGAASLLVFDGNFVWVTNFDTGTITRQ